MHNLFTLEWQNLWLIVRDDYGLTPPRAIIGGRDLMGMILVPKVAGTTDTVRLSCIEAIFWPLDSTTSGWTKKLHLDVIPF